MKRSGAAAKFYYLDFKEMADAIKKIDKKRLVFLKRKTQFGYANFRLKKLPNSILDQIITRYY